MSDKGTQKVRSSLFVTFFVQYIDGTGFPEALHSKVTAPPFRAVICPLDGTARTLGGTENLIYKLFAVLDYKHKKPPPRHTTKSLFLVFHY